MNIELEGGKLAPRLLIDLTQYDPRHPPPNNFNILSDLIFHDEGQDAPPPPFVGRGSCRHQWSTKTNQCSIPEDRSYKPEPGTSWELAAFCAQCRSHLNLYIHFPELQDGFQPCPTPSHPMHHFVYRPDISIPWRVRSTKLSSPGFAWMDKQCFQCTSQGCLTSLEVQFKPPRLTDEWVSQITDHKMIRARAEQAMAKDPQRYEGIAAPISVNVLEYLLQYTKNALFDPDPNRKINSDNRRFATCFGDACSELLFYIGFTKDGNFWFPPRPSPDQKTPYRDAHRILLDDVKEELCVLMSREPTEHIRSTKVIFQPVPVIPKMALALSCQEYKTNPRARIADLTIDEHPFYGGLGVMADFHDDLVGFAYDCQIASDARNVPYYLECLQVLGMGRESDELQTKAVIEQTKGRISLKDVRMAYSKLGLNAQDLHLADDMIISTFQARLVDAPKQEAELRNDLRIIGESRSSERIKLAASQDMATYEQALQFLGADESTGDDFIPDMVTMKIDEKPTDEGIARQAVALIANHRKSHALKNWLDTGKLGEVEMDVGQAYARLDITDRTVDDAAVLATYEVNVTEQPSQAEDLNRALTAIAISRDSKTLRERLGLDAGRGQYKLSEWPVGIENIGNTCYLNSLLQFYFSIKPLRDLVLDIDRYKMPVDDGSLKKKRVGSRNVSRKEVDRAQKFVDELQQLFRDLITSPKTSFKPSPNVARLTLLSSSKAEIARRQSMIAAERPSLGQGGLGQINGVSIQGPPGPPSTYEAGDGKTKILDETTVQSPVTEERSVRENIPSADNDHRSDDSSETLVDGPPTSTDAMSVDVEKQELALEDKENLPQPEHSQDGILSKEVDLEPLGNASPARLNEQAGKAQTSSEEPNLVSLLEDPQESAAMSLDNTTPTSQAPPNRPPPFPPRPQLQRETSDAIKEAEYGAQQDVTEVIANVLFQLQCAIKPESVDASGEQIDQIKDLFFGKQKSYITDKKGSIRTKEEYVTDIKVDVASGPRDIYAALDGAFDVQDVEVGGGIEPQYATISQLPPILSILIQRAQFDPAKKTTFKSDNHLDLKEVIFMDRYLDSDDEELMKRREESWAWKRQLAALEKRKIQLAESDMGAPVPEILQNTRDYLQQVKEIGDEDLDIPSSLISSVGHAAQAAQTEFSALESDIRDLQANISSQFNDLRSIVYRLAAVFIHVGSHNAGHYWIYIYDFVAQLWRKYNDEKVTELSDVKEIFEAPRAPRPPTPYYLVYVKDDLKEQLVDPVCRDVAEPPPDEDQDMNMQEDYTDVPVINDMVVHTGSSINTQHQQIIHDQAWSPSAPDSSEIQW